MARFQMPQATSQMVDGQGRPTTVWQQYFRGIEEMSGRVAANVAPLGASPTNAEIATALNAFRSALIDAGLMEDS